MAPQLMPVGLEATEPVPVPASSTVSLAMPVPLSVAAALSPGLADTFNDTPCLIPTACGAKLTPTAQVAFASRVGGQFFDEMTESSGSVTRADSVPVATDPCSAP